MCKVVCTLDLHKHTTADLITELIKRDGISIAKFQTFSGKTQNLTMLVVDMKKAYPDVKGGEVNG